MKEKEKRFWKWFDINLIYCSDTHSFVHRLFNEKDIWASYHDAQNSAFEIIKQMQQEFYKKRGVKEDGKNTRKR